MEQQQHHQPLALPLGPDTTGAVTWLDAKMGLELSSAVGFTFNGENPDTDYTTGTEFHVEWALVQHFSKTFSLGSPAITTIRSQAIVGLHNARGF